MIEILIKDIKRMKEDEARGLLSGVEIKNSLSRYVGTDFSISELQKFLDVESISYEIAGRDNIIFKFKKAE